MAMKAMYNAGAQLSLAQLNKNINKAGNAMAKLSSGQRKIGAQDDDSASFGISEKMREQIRSLLQDDQNIQNGSSMIKIAERGIDQIIQEIDRLKQLAIDAANDSNTDEDRRTIQKEFNSGLETINDIAIGTEYNGKKLLDGTWARKIVTHHTGSSGSSGGTETPSLPLPSDYESIYVDVASPDSTSETQITTSNNSPITAGGVYRIDPNFTGTITVNTTEPVQFTSSGTLSNVTIEGPSGGNANIWIDGLTVNNSNDNSFIRFQGSGNVLSVRGTNNFNSSGTITNAAINSGGGLNVQGNESSRLSINHRGTGAGIGSDSGGTSGNIGLVNLNLNINAGTGAGVGSGANNASVGDITVENCTGTFTGGTNSCIGSGYRNSSAGNILVVSSTIIDTNSVDTGIGSGYSGSSCGDITVRNSYVEVYNNDSPAIGAGDENGTCGDIYISNSEVNCSSKHGAAIGSGRRATVNGNITLINGTRVTHVARDTNHGDGMGDGAAVGTGEGGRVIGAIQISDSSIIDASRAYLDPDQVPPYSGIGKGRGGDASNIGDVEDIEDTEDPTDLTPHVETIFNPLWVQHGTQAGQRIHCYINSMQTKDLQSPIPNKADEAQLAALDYDPRKQNELRAILSAAKDMTLDDARVNTIENAKIAIRVVEGALEYALNEATTQGAYLQRLEYTDSNVISMGENVQNAESVIRDVDMAREMTEYTKYNILTQSSQAMLAQANQNGAAIISLLS